MTSMISTFLSRRSLLQGAAFASLAGALPALAEAAGIDLAALNAAPGNGEMSIGPADAKVTVIEYASATCPHCAAFATTVYPEFKKAYVDTNKVRYVFREFPLDDAALGAAMVARCAPKEKFFPLTDVIFKTQATWVKNPLEELKNIALQAGFTSESFTACINDQKVAAAILETRKKGSDFGIKGVPAFFINGTLLEGEATLDELKAKIDPLLG